MKILAAIIFLATGSQAWANSNHCVMSINREACPGKESEAFAPYNGANPTQLIRFTQNEGDCLTMVERESKILRKRILKKITVTGTYGGNTLGPVSTEEPCGPASRVKKSAGKK